MTGDDATMAGLWRWHQEQGAALVVVSENVDALREAVATLQAAHDALGERLAALADAADEA